MNNLTTKKSAELAVETPDFAEVEFSASDLVIPKIMAMQPTSELVSQERAKYGDFINSVTEEIIGNIESKPIEFIPFFAVRKWCVQKKDPASGKLEFLSFEPITKENQGLPYESQENGETIIRTMYRDIYVLLADSAVPFIVQFKGVSGRAGKVLMSNMYVYNTLTNGGKTNPALFVWKLAGIKRSNDKGRFIELACSQSRRSTQDEINEAAKWSKLVNGQALEISTKKDKPEEAKAQDTDSTYTPF
jgi:hypothetical protein